MKTGDHVTHIYTGQSVVIISLLQMTSQYGQEEWAMVGLNNHVALVPVTHLSEKTNSPNQNTDLVYQAGR